MTEEEWLSGTRPEPLLEHLEESKQFDKRMARLLGVAFCRRIWDLIDDQFYRVVELAELRADGLASWREVDSYIPPVRSDGRARTSHDDPAEVAAHATTSKKIRPGYIAWLTRHAVVRSFEEPSYKNGHDREATPQLALLFEIFGNPFRPVAFSPEWRTTTAAAIAQSMYESRDFGPMPLLADALQDAGCEVPEIIDHCRGPGPHVRGCWVVDGVLGKS